MHQGLIKRILVFYEIPNGCHLKNKLFINAIEIYNLIKWGEVCIDNRRRSLWENKILVMLNKKINVNGLPIRGAWS